MHSGNPNVSPLAQDYEIVRSTPDRETYYVHDPGMTRLENGHLLVATCIRSRKPGVDPFTYLSSSTDGGCSWKHLGTVPFSDATAIVQNGALYLMGQYRQGTDWLIMRSDDEGRTWTDPVTLFEGRYWNCQTSMVRRNGHLYWAMSDMPDSGHWHATVAVACDLSRDILDPATWRVSAPVEPPYPMLCSRDARAEQWEGSMGTGGLSCLEPNVVQVGDRLIALSRAVISGYTTANMGVVFDITDDGDGLRLDFTQFSPIPGGQCKFFVLFDDVTDLFFLLTNLPTDSHDALGIRPDEYNGGVGNERRLLYLFYGRDALNWFPAGCVARMPHMLQSFMYPSAVIDGEDIALISRTSKDARNQHDADLCTFHRIRNFRDLAMDLRPAEPDATPRITGG